MKSHTDRHALWRSRWQLGILLALGLNLLPAWPYRPIAAQSTQAGTVQNVLGTLVVVRTEAASQALIDIKDGVQVALNEHSSLKILSRWEKAKGITRIMRLQHGEIWVKTGTGPKLLEVETPVATAAVRETEFNIKVLEDGQTSPPMSSPPSPGPKRS